MYIYAYIYICVYTLSFSSNSTGGKLNTATGARDFRGRKSVKPCPFSSSPNFAPPSDAVRLPIA